MQPKQDSNVGLINSPPLAPVLTVDSVDAATENFNELLLECKSFFSKLGFSIESRLNGITTFISPELVSSTTESQVIKFHVWEGCSQVDLWSIGKNGNERKVKDLIWGWVIHSFDDIKILFSYQADLRLLATINGS